MIIAAKSKTTILIATIPIVMDKVSLELGAQREQFRLSLKSRVENPESTLASFNRQFALNGGEKDSVEWAWPQEAGETSSTWSTRKHGRRRWRDWRRNRVFGCRVEMTTEN